MNDDTKNKLKLSKMILKQIINYFEKKNNFFVGSVIV